MTPGHHILLTGVTGFVGKVVLERLLRHSERLNVGRVTVLIRPAKRRDGSVRPAEERFRRDVATAELFERLDEGWARRVSVVEGDLERTRCGLSNVEVAELRASLTHVVHCAASIG